MHRDSELRRAALGLEARLAAAVCDEERAAGWGRAYLTPSLPLVWDASLLVLEAIGLEVEAVADLAEEEMGAAGFDHRTVVVADEAEGRRLAAAVGRLPGWSAERTLYMAWPEDGAASPREGVREVGHAEVAALRGELIGGWLRSGEEREATVAQLLERDRRLGAAAGDRWFVAAADGEPAASCRLLRLDGLAQVEDVGTLERARDRGLAQAVVLAAVAAAREAGDAAILIAADADDWPWKLYAKLGFRAIGEVTALRRLP